MTDPEWAYVVDSPAWPLDRVTDITTEQILDVLDLVTGTTVSPTPTGQELPADHRDLAREGVRDGSQAA